MSNTQTNEIKRSDLPNVGASFAGGFYAGEHGTGGNTYALVVAPKAEGQIKGQWGLEEVDLPGATSAADGYLNTIAMSNSGSQVAEEVLGMVINGQSGWYIPSSKELLTVYMNLKPTDNPNHCEESLIFQSDCPYELGTPAQTAVIGFQEGGENCLCPNWFWTSTQYDPILAISHDFRFGRQEVHTKDAEFRIRVMRRMKIT